MTQKEWAEYANRLYIEGLEAGRKEKMSELRKFLGVDEAIEEAIEDLIASMREDKE